MRATSLLLFAYSSITNNNNNDATFMQWCSDIGIKCPGAELRTTSKSVAGRGVFSTQDLSTGDEIISIPYYAALTQENAAEYFPTLASELEQIVMQHNRRSSSKASYLKRIWNKLRRRKSVHREESETNNDDKRWKEELTAYALTALENNHAWSPWIDQWKRDDPLQTLVDNTNIDDMWSDDEAGFKTSVSDFHEMAPAIPEYKIGGALWIRLQQLVEYLNLYQNRVPTSGSLYMTLISRAIGLSENVTAVLPMHDMINHSPSPNVGLVLAEDETIKIVAIKDIPKDEELFMTYFDVIDEEGEWDEDKATWLLCQWGIPSSPVDTTIQRVEEEAMRVMSKQ